MPSNLSQIVTEKMEILPLEEQQKVVEFVDSLIQGKSKTLLEKIEERVGKLSAKTLNDLPADGAANLDYYLYGAPKKEK